MDEKYFQRIYPTPEELSSVQTRVRCPQSNCNAIFQSTSNLNMHLIKRHKIDNNGLAKKTETQYFCPSDTCPYYKDSQKHFTKLKYLKQHFLKVHAVKNFVCQKCDKKFSTASFKTSHVKNCGKLFTCSCGLHYSSREAILTHCKRKGKEHSYLQKSKINVQNNDNNVAQTKEIFATKKTERLIYPKLSSDISFPIHYIAAMALSELSAPCNLSKVFDKGIQTDSADFGLIKGNNGFISIQKFEKKKKSSQQTQTTGKLKKLKISAQTQTNSDYLKQKVKNHLKTVSRKRKKSMETQTKDLYKAYNNIFLIGHSQNNVNEQCMGDVKLPDSNANKLPEIRNEEEIAEDINENGGLDKGKTKKWLWNNQFVGTTQLPRGDEMKNELFNIGGELNLCSKEPSLNECTYIPAKNIGTQYFSEQASDSQLFDLNKLCNIETQTEIDAFFTECSNDSAFTLFSTTETQTPNDFDSLLYSNMCTQTCEEVDQLFNFNFVNIETQTTWPNLSDCQDLN